MPRTLTLDDIFAIERVADAQISPDGAQIAFVVTREFTEGEHALPAASIWMVPFEGSAPARQFTASAHADSHPRWSPDGKALAFLSDREKADTPQVYVMPSDGGEARKLTSAKAGVSGFAWSPDGARIAFAAADAPTEEEERRAKERDDAIHVDHDYKFTRLWVIDAQGGEARALTSPDYQTRAFEWRHDGWAIVTSPTPKEDDLEVPWTLRLIAEDGEITTLWEGKYPIDLASSHDGRSLAWSHSGVQGAESADEVWVARDGDEPRVVISDYSGGTLHVQFTPDGAALLLVGVQGTRMEVGQLDLATGALETLLADTMLAFSFATSPSLSASADGTRLATVLTEADQPPAVYAWTPGAEPRQVSARNQHLADVSWGRAETVEWTAPDGLRIEGVLIYPADYEEGKRYPLIAQIHGGPTGFWLRRFLAGWHDWAQWLAANGYAVLLPNPRGSAGRGREFAWRNQRNWGHGDFPDILSGVDALIARGVADPDRLGIGGWSYGGYMTAWAIGHTDRFKAAIVGAGVTDLLSFQAADIPSWLPNSMMLAQPYDDQAVYLRSSPISAAADMKTPTLILHGASDERVRLGQGKELYNALRARDVVTEMVIYPREPHIFQERAHQRDLLTRVLAWYNRWLKE